MSRDSGLKFRNHSIYLSGEVYTYLAMTAKALVAGTEASMTVDQVADNLLREKITRENPELPAIYAKLEEEKAKARSNYKSIEQEMVEAIGVVKTV